MTRSPAVGRSSPGRSSRSSARTSSGASTPGSPDRPTTSTPTWPTSSPGSGPSDPTTPPPSSSPDSAPSPANSSTSSSSRISHEHRVFVTGPTRSGKSTLVRQMFLSTAAPRLILDPADSSLTASIPGTVTFSDVRKATNAKGESWREAATARFVPTDPADVEAYDEVYRWAFRHGPRYVWCDEAGQILPVRGGPKWGNTYLVQGAKRMLGHIACHTRPREVNSNLIAQAQHVFIFGLPHPADVDHVAGLVGVPPATLAAELRAMPWRSFLWFDGVARRLTHCPALQV